MADTAGETSNNSDDNIGSDKAVKVNGEMNGSYCDGVEPMDVDIDSSAVKQKLTNSKSSNEDDTPPVKEDDSGKEEDSGKEGDSCKEGDSGKEDGEDEVAEAKNKEVIEKPVAVEEKLPSDSNLKVNGDMNGSHNDSVEPMEVDSAMPPAKVSSEKSSTEDDGNVPEVEEEKESAKKIVDGGKENDGDIDSSLNDDDSSSKAEDKLKGNELDKSSDEVEDVEKTDETTKMSNDSANDDDKSESKDEDVVDSKKDGESNDLNSSGKEGNESSVDATPEKVKKNKKSPAAISPITPRRSSRNLNKQKSYSENDKDIDKLIKEGVSPSLTIKPVKVKADDDEIEEILPVDPLAGDSSSVSILPTPPKIKNKTIVVNDTKRLAEIAGSKHLKNNKKEPTLVIIDTNAILSGRGPVPISTSAATTHVNIPSSRSPAFSMLPVALPAQGMYPTIRATTAQVIPKPVVIAAPPKQPAILPTLTDDMFVVEAPSFIVPYVYEKPPVKHLKEYLGKMEQSIKKEEERKVKEAEDKKVKAAEEKERKLKEDEKAKEDASKADESEEGKEKQDADKSSDSKEDAKKENEETDEAKNKDKEGSPDKKAEEASVKEEKKEDVKKEEVKEPEKKKEEEEKTKKSSNSYFDAPLGKFFMQIGINLVQEHVQTDLLRSQKRKLDKEGAKCPPDTQLAIESLSKTLEFSKENNDPFRLPQKKCEYCSFKTESALVMAHHLETPHMKNYVYRCNFCPLEVRSPHDILYHMEAQHNMRGRLERAPAFHQCPSCPFEDNQKGKLTRHLISCCKKYRPERNQESPMDWEPPAKIPRVTKNRPSMSPGNAVYQAAMSGLKQGGTVHHPLLPKLAAAPIPSNQSLMNRGRGRPQTPAASLLQRFPSPVTKSALSQAIRPGMIYRPSGSNSQPQVLLPTSYQIAGNQLFQSIAGQKMVQSQGLATAKLLNQPSISITPLPRQGVSTPPSNSQQVKPGRPPTATGKAQFVICEICDGYIKDLEQLRNHMQWIHKVKIHPKMIYNRPPLNCQKCQFRFFTDQGLERHLLGSHGLVTSSMQEAANKGKDGGRCPVCGRVYQWKLLNHVARDHNMSLKPAHLSYKCTVCTATFGMYKQFENHVYSAHSVVAKRVMDKKVSSPQPSTSSSQVRKNESLLKPLKINDEITIIPQPASRATKPSSSTSKTVVNRQPVKKVMKSANNIGSLHKMLNK